MQLLGARVPLAGSPMEVRQAWLYPYQQGACQACALQGWCASYQAWRSIVACQMISTCMDDHIANLFQKVA